jgi:hypothetical protein
VFHMDVTKVNQDVAYVAMAIYSCCKCLFQMFHLFIRSMLHAFYVDVAYVSRICCIHYTHMLQVFYLDVTYACHGFQVFSDVLQVFQTDVASISVVLDVCCKCFIRMLHIFCNGFSSIFWCFCKYFRCTFQVFDVSVVSRCFKTRLGVAHGMCVGSGRGTSFNDPNSLQPPRPSILYNQ